MDDLACDATVVLSPNPRLASFVPCPQNVREAKVARVGLLACHRVSYRSLRHKRIDEKQLECNRNLVPKLATKMNRLITKSVEIHSVEIMV